MAMLFSMQYTMNLYDNIFLTLFHFILYSHSISDMPFAYSKIL